MAMKKHKLTVVSNIGNFLTSAAHGISGFFTSI